MSALFGFIEQLLDLIGAQPVGLDLIVTQPSQDRIPLSGLLETTDSTLSIFNNPHLTDSTEGFISDEAREYLMRARLLDRSPEQVVEQTVEIQEFSREPEEVALRGEQSFAQWQAEVTVLLAECERGRR